MEVRNGNIFLSSSQNVMSLESNGSEKYHGYYKSPGKSGFMKVVGMIVLAKALLTMENILIQ